jgi:hypothetical protein
MGSFKKEAADRMILVGEGHRRRVVDEYLEDYHRERNQQGLGGSFIRPGPEVGAVNGKIRRCRRLGGMFNGYYRGAA